jgi:hypothetical protein
LLFFVTEAALGSLHFRPPRIISIIPEQLSWASAPLQRTFKAPPLQHHKRFSFPKRPHAAPSIRFLPLQRFPFPDAAASRPSLPQPDHQRFQVLINLLTLYRIEPSSLISCWIHSWGLLFRAFFLSRSRTPSSSADTLRAFSYSNQLPAQNPQSIQTTPLSGFSLHVKSPTPNLEV